jgi:hypothetical protein
VAEGAPLLREYGALNSIEGSNPSLSANNYAVTPRLVDLVARESCACFILDETNSGDPVSFPCGLKSIILTSQA